MVSLPPDTMFQILSTLPIKSLCRFKCVSKWLLSLIIDPMFAKLHLKLSHQFQSRTLVFSAARFLYSIDFDSTYGDHDRNVVVATKLDFPFEDVSSIKLVGSCNGLLCVVTPSYSHSGFIYNPSTREYRKIPYFSGSTPFFSHTILYGFGFVVSIDDYKLVKIDFEETIVSIFSLKTNSWKSIEDFNFPFDCNFACYKPGVYLNGAIHWVFHYKDKYVIFAFDLGEEKFKNLESGVRKSWKYSVGVMGDCLCLILEGHPNEIFFWVMRDYGGGSGGAKEDWGKVLVDYHDKHIQVKPLCSWKKDELIFLCIDFEKLAHFRPKKVKGGNGYCEDVKLLLRKTKRKTKKEAYKDVVLDGVRTTWPAELLYKFDNLCLYTESIVSPNKNLTS